MCACSACTLSSTLFCSYTVEGFQTAHEQHNLQQQMHAAQQLNATAVELHPLEAYLVSKAVEGQL
jgi:hypothetical protein